jgi:hypothetical protein
VTKTKERADNRATAAILNLRNKIGEAESQKAKYVRWLSETETEIRELTQAYLGLGGKPGTFTIRNVLEDFPFTIASKNANKKRTTKR